MHYRADYDAGLVSGAAFWRAVGIHFGRRFGPNEIDMLISEDIAAWTHLNEEMVARLAAWRAHFGRLAMLSNMNVDILAFMRKHFAWLDLFDRLVFSCEEKLLKPDGRIYRCCLERLDLPPAACFFVDDTPANVSGARAQGLAAARFTGAAALDARLARWSLTGR